MSEIGSDVNTRFPGLALLDRIYELLSGIDEDLLLLKHQFSSVDRIYVYETNNILNAVELLISFKYDNRLGLSESDISKFERMQGRIKVQVLRKVGEHAKALLRELEGEVARQVPANLPSEQPTSQSSEEQRTPFHQVTIPVQAWVRLRRESNADLIAEISTLLDEAIYLAKSSNLPSEYRAFSELDRAQLITLLETAINLLRAPLVEKGLLHTLKEAATTGAANAVRKKAELALGYGLGKLAEKLVKLISGLE